MFFSTHLLLRNGKFAVVWRVAKDSKRVKKEEVIKISVPLKCKELQDCEIPLARRLQAELAHGIVKIYGFQMQYLLEDCIEARILLRDTSGSVDLVERGSKEANLQDVETLDFLHESFAAELESRLEALGEMDFEEMRRIVSASKSLDRGSDANRVDNSFELNMSVEKFPKAPQSKFEESFEDFNDGRGGMVSMFDFLDEEIPEIVRNEISEGISMDFDETVVISKDKDKSKAEAEKSPNKGAQIEESSIEAPEISRIAEEEVSSENMDIDGVDLGEEEKEKDAEKEFEKAKEKQKIKPRRRGKKRKWKDAKAELSDAQIRKQFDEKDELVRDYDSSCFAKPPPTKKNMRIFHDELPDFVAQSKMPLGERLRALFNRQYLKMLKQIKEKEKQKLEDELNATFEEIIAEPPPDPSEVNPLDSALLTIPSSQNQSITIVEDVSELPSAQFLGAYDLSSDSDPEKSSDFIPSTQMKEASASILQVVEDRKEDGGASFFGFAKGKDPRDVATMLYAILQLKSAGKLDVHQEEPYGDMKLSSGF